MADDSLRLVISGDSRQAVAAIQAYLQSVNQAQVQTQQAAQAIEQQTQRMATAWQRVTQATTQYAAAAGAMNSQARANAQALQQSAQAATQYGAALNSLNTRKAQSIQQMAQASQATNQQATALTNLTGRAAPAAQAIQQVGAAAQTTAAAKQRLFSQTVSLGLVFGNLPGPLGQATAAMGMLHVHMSQNQQMMLALGTAATTLGTALGGGLVEAVQQFREFQRNMADVQVVTNATAAQMGELTHKALEMGITTQFNSKEAAKGLYELSSAGLTVRETLTSVDAVVRAATLGHLDLGKATDDLTGVMRQWGMQAEDMNKIVDIQTFAIQGSKLHWDEIGAAYRNVAGRAHAMGVSLEESTAALMLMNNAGLTASMSGTALGTFLDRLNKQTGEAKAGAEALGLQIYTEQGQFVGLQSVVEQVERATENMTDEQANQAISLLAGARASGFLRNALTAQYTTQENGVDVTYRGAEAFRKMTEGAEQSGGASKRAADIIKATLDQAIREMTGALGDAQIMLGRQFAPAATGAAQAVRGIAAAFVEAPGSIQATTAAVLASQAAVLALGGTALTTAIGLRTVSAAITMVGLTAGGVIPILGAVMAASALLAVAWANDWGGIQGKTSTAVMAVESEIARLQASLGTIGRGIGGAVAGARRDAGMSLYPDPDQNRETGWQRLGELAGLAVRRGFVQSFGPTAVASIIADVTNGIAARVNADQLATARAQTAGQPDMESRRVEALAAGAMPNVVDPQQIAGEWTAAANRIADLIRASGNELGLKEAATEVLSQMIPDADTTTQWFDGLRHNLMQHYRQLGIDTRDAASLIFRPEALDLDALSAEIGKQGLKVKELLESAFTPESAHAVMEYEGAVKTVDKAITEITDRSLAAYIQTLKNTDQLQLAVSLSTDHMAAQDADAAAAKEALATNVEHLTAELVKQDAAQQASRQAQRNASGIIGEAELIRREAEALEDQAQARERATRAAELYRSNAGIATLIEREVAALQEQAQAQALATQAQQAFLVLNYDQVVVNQVEALRLSAMQAQAAAEAQDAFARSIEGTEARMQDQLRALGQLSVTAGGLKLGPEGTTTGTTFSIDQITQAIQQQQVMAQVQQGITIAVEMGNHELAAQIALLVQSGDVYGAYALAVNGAAAAQREQTAATKQQEQAQQQLNQRIQEAAQKEDQAIQRRHQMMNSMADRDRRMAATNIPSEQARIYQEWEQQRQAQQIQQWQQEALQRDLDAAAARRRQASQALAFGAGGVGGARGEIGRMPFADLAQQAAQVAQGFTQTAQQAVESYRETLSPGTGSQIGSDFVMGVVNGIVDSAGASSSAIQQLAQDVLATMQSQLGIASPSKVMADEVGRPMGEGIVEGFRATWGSSLSDLSRDMTESMWRAVGQESAQRAQQGALSQWLPRFMDQQAAMGDEWQRASDNVAGFEHAIMQTADGTEVLIERVRELNSTLSDGLGDIRQESEATLASMRALSGYMPQGGRGYVPGMTSGWSSTARADMAGHGPGSREINRPLLPFYPGSYESGFHDDDAPGWSIPSQAQELRGIFGQLYDPATGLVDPRLPYAAPAGNAAWIRDMGPGYVGESYPNRHPDMPAGGGGGKGGGEGGGKGGGEGGGGEGGGKGGGSGMSQQEEAYWKAYNEEMVKQLAMQDPRLAGLGHRELQAARAQISGGGSGSYAGVPNTLMGENNTILLGNPRGVHEVIQYGDRDRPDPIKIAMYTASLAATEENLGKLATAIQKGEMLITQSLNALATDFNIFGAALQNASADQAKAGAASAQAAAIGPVDNAPGSTTGSYINLLTQYGWQSGGRAAGPGGITMMQHGGHGIVDGPSLFMMGEAGPEAFDIRPLGAGGGAGALGAGDANIISLNQMFGSTNRTDATRQLEKVADVLAPILQKRGFKKT